jgi:hypothetical protein
MIQPTAIDIGRKVIYTGNRFPGGQLEYGVITSFNALAVFVRYGTDIGSKSTFGSDLEWFRPDKCPCGLPWDECPWNACVHKGMSDGAHQNDYR